MTDWVEEWVLEREAEFGTFFAMEKSLGPVRVIMISTPWKPGDWFYSRVHEAPDA